MTTAMRQRFPILRSLRARLTALLLAVVLGAALLQGLSAYHSAQQQADALLDAHLQQMADALRGGMSAHRPSSLFSEAETRALNELLVQIWGSDGASLFRSPHADLPRLAVLGFSEVTVEGSRYRVYTLQTPLQTIQIAQDMTARQQHARALAWRAVWPIAIAAPLLMLAVWAVVGLSLRPVERARRQLALRQADDLSPLPEQELPTEVQPLVHELNQLFARVHDAFEAQKSFVADAAHELRSPLAALKLQAQALRPALSGSGPGPLRALQRLEQGITRATQLVEQLLLLAREEAAECTPGSRTEVQAVLATAVADILPQASGRHIEVGLSTAPAQPLYTQASAASLRILLRNLLDNAVKYSPTGSSVDLRLNLTGSGQPRLIIDDAGPGIAAAERNRVFDRFYRSPDLATQASGSGLGLAIVRAIAERQHIEVTLDQTPQGQGLRVALTLPAAVSEPRD